MSRHSITKALASSRGTRTLIANAEVRYAKSFEISLRLRLALRSVNDAEKRLRFALRDAMALDKCSKTRRAA